MHNNSINKIAERNSKWWPYLADVIKKADFAEIAWKKPTFLKMHSKEI
jgi:hypothetical protein